MMATTTSLAAPFQYSGDSIDDYKKKAELSPWGKYYYYLN